MSENPRWPFIPLIQATDRAGKQYISKSNLQFPVLLTSCYSKLAQNSNSHRKRKH